MSDSMQCLCCKGYFKQEEMHVCQKSKAQLCIKCSIDLRAKRRAVEFKEKKERMKDYMAEEHEKAVKLADKLMGKSKPTKKARRKPSVFQDIEAEKYRIEMLKLTMGDMT